MREGDRVVVLASEHRGVIDHISHQGSVMVLRDDLPEEHPLQPVPYDPHELEVCWAREAA